MSNSVVHGAHTDAGRQRTHNEDSYLVDEAHGLFVVCDGMGGHAAGAYASKIASKCLAKYVAKNKPLIQDYLADPRSDTRLRILEMLEAGANVASINVRARAQKDPSKQGMGCTLVAALIVGTQAFIVHVGDSRCYVLRGGDLEQLTEDHNAFNDLVKRQGIPIEQLAGKINKSRLTRAIGVYEYVEPDSLMVDLESGDRLLLCSDGLSSYFEKDAAPLAKLLGSGEPSQASARLIEAANERGGADNVTAVVIGIVGSKPTAGSRARRIERARETVKKIPLFRRLDSRELRHILQIIQVVKVAAGTDVIVAGDRGDCLYIVIKGEYRIQTRQETVGVLKPGEHFGELALIRNHPRTATITALSDGELLMIRREDFFHIVRKNHRMGVKMLWSLSRTLVKRVQSTMAQQ